MKAQIKIYEPLFSKCILYKKILASRSNNFKLNQNEIQNYLNILDIYVCDYIFQKLSNQH